MIRKTLIAFAALALTSCASGNPKNVPPEIVVSNPVYTVFYDIPEAILDCPDVLGVLVLPAPDGEGKYAASDVDGVIANLYGHSSSCSSNMSAIKDSYNSAKKKYDNGGSVE
jgi:hypothetical protein